VNLEGPRALGGASCDGKIMDTLEGGTPLVVIRPGEHPARFLPTPHSFYLVTVLPNLFPSWLEVFSRFTQTSPPTAHHSSLLDRPVLLLHTQSLPWLPLAPLGEQLRCQA
jgi:hypothetical protein